MSRRCIIPSCFEDTSCSLFGVPKNIDWREKWLEAVRHVCPNLNIGDKYRVCEKHFRKTDFTSCFVDKSGKIVQEVAVERKRLKQGAVPHFDVLILDLENDSEKTMVNKQAEPFTYGKRFLRKVSWFQPQHHLEHGLVTLQNSSIKMHTFVKEEIEEDSAALHDYVQFKPEHPDCETERAFNMQTAIKSEIEEVSAALHGDVQFKRECADRERKDLIMETAIKSEIEEVSAALHGDVQVKRECADRKRKDLIMETAIKSEIEEDSAALHCDMQLKHEQPDRERELALNMPTEKRSEVEEDSAGIYGDVQVKHKHCTTQLLSELYAEHMVKEELVIDTVLQRPRSSTEQLCTDVNRKHLNKTAVPSIFTWNQVASPIKCEFLTLEDSNSLSDSGLERKDVDPMAILISSASSATSVTETESSAASDLKTDYDVVVPFKASGIKKTYSKQGAPSPKIPRLKRNDEIIEQEKLADKENDDTDKEENVSETLTPEATVENQSTESVVDKQIFAEYKAFTCNDCRKQFKSKPELVQHIEIHNKNISKLSFYCTKCEYTAATRDTLEKHFFTFHYKQGQHACEICSSTFETQEILLSHLKHCHTIKKDLTCKICNKFKTNNLCDSEVHLSFEEPFSCPQCTQQSNLRHTRTHTGEKLYFCSQCEYNCTKISNMKRHMRIHTGEKPFQCLHFSCFQCQYKCSTLNLLKIHLRSHTGEKPFHCQQCQFRCTTQGGLKIHLRTHIREKPFSCSQCLYRCAQQSQLKVHISRNHDKGTNLIPVEFIDNVNKQVINPTIDCLLMTSLKPNINP